MLEISSRPSDLGHASPSETPSSPISLTDVSETTLERLIHDMDHNGFGMIPDFVPPRDLDRMRSFVGDAITAAGRQYVGFVGKAAVAGSVFADVSDLPAFQTLMRRVYERGTGRHPPDADLYQVLRCLAGQTGEAHSLIFHYDSYVVTALIPVEIPTGDQTGDLIIVKPRRKIRATYMANLIDKILLDNKMTQAILGRLHKSGFLPCRRVRMVPGNIYFFWGYRSIHANEACDPKHVRATAIYHFANPHAGNRFFSMVRTLLPRR